MKYILEGIEEVRRLTRLSTWIRFLSTWPFLIRFSIVTACFLICLGIYILVFPVTHQGNILTIPLIMSAWMFKRRGMLLMVGIGVALLMVYQTYRLGTLGWPTPFALSFFSNALILLFVGFVIAALRDFVDATGSARQQAQQAQEQMTLAYEEQRQLNALKTQFILNVNHELRTPLTAILGSLELCQLILEREGSLERTLHEDYLKIAAEQGEKLRTLVEEVLDSKIITDQNVQSVDEKIAIAPLVQQVLHALDARERECHPILLDIPEHLTVWADTEKMSRVLAHLLSNACKYSPTGTPITISAKEQATSEQREHPGHVVCISVQDRGPGIPSDELSSIFDQFTRLKRNVGGTIPGNGLGLYISKTLVEAMNGHLWAESTGRDGEGSCFHFTLPCPPLQQSVSKVRETSLPS